MTKNLKQKVGASDGSRAMEEWVRSPKEERQYRLTAELAQFLKTYYKDPDTSTKLAQMSSSADIDLVFKKPKIVIEFSESEPLSKDGGRIIFRRGMFEAEDIADPSQIEYYLDELKPWLKDTEQFGRIWADDREQEMEMEMEYYTKKNYPSIHMGAERINANAEPDENGEFIHLYHCCDFKTWMRVTHEPKAVILSLHIGGDAVVEEEITEKSLSVIEKHWPIDAEKIKGWMEESAELCAELEWRKREKKLEPKN